MLPLNKYFLEHAPYLHRENDAQKFKVIQSRNTRDCFIWRMKIWFTPTFLLVVMTILQSESSASDSNYFSHSNQDTVDFSSTRHPKKRLPLPPGEPLPPPLPPDDPPMPPPPGGRHRSDKSPSNPASILLVAHQYQTDHLYPLMTCKINSQHFLRPMDENFLTGSATIVPGPTGLILLVFAGRHRRRRIAYGGPSTNGCIHDHSVRPPPGKNHQSSHLS